MKSRADLVVGPGGAPGRPVRIERMLDAAPVAWRPTPDGVYMVGSSASPVGDDDVGVSVRVRSGAHLVIRSVAAAVAWTGTGTRQTVSVEVEDGAALDWAPEPLIATRGCDHTQTCSVRLGAGATLRWREILVLGRHHEQAGRLRSYLSVDNASGPVLRHDLTSGTPVAATPAVLGPARAVGLLLMVGRQAGGAAVVATDRPGVSLAVTDLETGDVLVTAVGPGPAPVAAALDGALRPISP